MKCNMPRHAPSRTIPALIAGLAVAFAAAGADAQSLDAYTFKVSHNSYERDESLSEQVLALNCWGLELDLCWSDSSDRFVVRHATSPPCLFGQQGPLTDWLFDLTVDPRIYSRVTMLYLDLHSFNCIISDDCLEIDVFRVNDLIATLDNYLPRSRVYTVRDLDADGGVWPSPQELIRRGKSFIVFVSKGDSYDQYNYFHHQAGSASFAAPSTSLINRSDAELPSGESPQPDDRLLWRSFPGTLQEWDEPRDLLHFTAAVNRQFNLVACNFLDRDWTNFSGTIPAMPMHVDPVWGGQQTGAVYRPYQSLLGAIQRIEQVNTRGISRTEPFPITLLGNTQPNYHVGLGPVDPSVPLEIRPNEFRTVYIRP